MADPSSPKLSVCLVGCGSMGQLHGKTILQHPDVKSLSVCDANLASAKSYANDIDTDWMPVEDALKSDSFDAYFIVSPPFAHLEQVTRAVQNGAYVLCEKPLGEEMSSIDAAMPALKPFADRIQVGFNRRFDPHMAALKKRVMNGDIGKIEQLRIVSRDFTAPGVDELENSAGLIAETAIHDFDLTRWLLDDELIEVMCLGEALINPAYAAVGHIDTATTVLRGSAGQQVVIQNSWRTSFGYDQRVEAFGALGQLTVANPAGPLVVHENESGLHRDRIASDWFGRYPEAYAQQDHTFLDAASRGTSVSPNLNDGYAASYIAQKVAESQQSGTPVAVDLNLM